jgi:hypothetical protein
LNQSQSGESSQRLPQRILDGSTSLLHKNVKNFADKKDKGFPLSFRVGLAYMVLGTLQRKNSGFFRWVTLVVETLLTSNNWGQKCNFNPQRKPPYGEIQPLILEILPDFSFCV